MEEKELRSKASLLTFSLYRSMLRSIRTIRQGNEHDEIEFQERERKREQPKPTDIRLSMISLLPAVNRADELRSRAEYYTQYARENIAQESDCLDALNRASFRRFFYLIRRGEEHRKWLLSDMKFDDPLLVHPYAFDLERVSSFEKQVNEFLGQEMSSEDYKLQLSSETDIESNDGWSTDEDENDEPSLPSWFKNPTSQ